MQGQQQQMQGQQNSLIPARVSWNEPRKATDVPFAVLYVLSVVLFLGLGFSMVGSSHGKYVTTGKGEDLTIDLDPYWTEDAKTCCSSIPDGYSVGLYGGLCHYVNGGRRSLAEGDSSFPSDGYMFDAFTLAPQIPAVLISGVLFMAVAWIVLLKMFSKPIVFLTEFLKVAAMVYVGIKFSEGKLLVPFLFALCLSYYISCCVWVGK